MSITVDSGPVAAPAGMMQEEESHSLSVRQLQWLRFKRNRLAGVGALFLIVMYLAAALANFVSPYGVRTTHDLYPAAPPHGPRFFDAEGSFHLRPFVYGLEPSINPETFAKVYTPVEDVRYPVYFFVKAEPYGVLGLFEMDRHLFGVEEPGKIFLFGTDRQGRDLFTRTLFGARVSLTIGLVGVFMTLVIGTIVGIASGLFGGLFDNITQRIVEMLQSFPLLPLWMALAILVPPNWSSIRVYFAISIVLALVSWGPLARQVRGMVLALRETDFITAARYSNCSNWRIINKHLRPNTMGHVLVIATLAVPSMILGETALSFLGLGIRPPMTSWGVLLTETQQVRVLLTQPWMLIPAIFVILSIISFNFLGDGIREAANPFE